MPVEWAGNGGRILVGYQRAADLPHWEICRRDEYLGDPITILTGTLANIDPFWIDYTNVVVHLEMGKCRWQWDQAELQSVEPLIVLLDGNPRAV